MRYAVSDAFRFVCIAGKSSSNINIYTSASTGTLYTGSQTVPTVTSNAIVNSPAPCITHHGQYVFAASQSTTGMDVALFKGPTSVVNNSVKANTVIGQQIYCYGNN